MYIPYGKQDVTQEDIDAVVETLKSDFLTQGPKVQEFEEDKVKIMDDFILKNKSNFSTEDLKLSSKLKK